MEPCVLRKQHCSRNPPNLACQETPNHKWPRCPHIIQAKILSILPRDSCKTYGWLPHVPASIKSRTPFFSLWSSSLMSIFPYCKILNKNHIFSSGASRQLILCFPHTWPTESVSMTILFSVLKELFLFLFFLQRK